METVIGIIFLGALVCACIWGMSAEIKHMKMCTAKAKEEMEFFRSFRAYLEDLGDCTDVSR